MHNSLFAGTLWYLEFFAFTFTLIGFFYFVLYLASLNYVNYSPNNDFRKKTPARPRVRCPPVPEARPIDTKPICCDAGCIWFCSLMFSIVTIGMCYYLAYTLLSDTKLRFGLFMP